MRSRVSGNYQIPSWKLFLGSFCIGAVQLINSYCCNLQKWQRIAGKIAMELFLSSNADLQNSKCSLPHMPWIHKTLSLSNSQCPLCSNFSLQQFFQGKNERCFTLCVSLQLLHQLLCIASSDRSAKQCTLGYTARKYKLITLMGETSVIFI